jgi:hypothetical protein
MPLSDRERKLLDELELDLVAKDPRLAHELSSGSLGDRFKAMYYAALACLVGVVLLIAGVASQVTAVGVIGFLLMGVGTYVLVGGDPERPPRPINPRPDSGPGIHGHQR